MKIADIPVVFLSYDEPWADAFFADLLSKAPGAKRVHGVKGLDACHKAAAEEAGERWFITVDADTKVDPSFFAASIPDENLNDNCRVEWASRNVVNGLAYGNGSLKCWPRDLVQRMRTHEATPKGVVSVDHDIGKGSASNKDAYGIQLPEIHSRTYPAETPFHAFRCGFREGVRLSTPRDSTLRGKGFLAHLSTWHANRIRIWCSVGAQARNGDWLIYGARLGLIMNQLGEWDRTRINDFDWFEAFWDDILTPRFGIEEGGDDQSDVVCDPIALREEIFGLGERIVSELGVDVSETSPEVSDFLQGCIQESRSPTVVDTIGNMYLKGLGVEQNYTQAHQYFSVGCALNLAASYNNLARMYQKGQGVETNNEKAIQNYEIAVALENEFAPYHLAALLVETQEPDTELMARIEGLQQLSIERGFTPPRKIGFRKSVK